MTPRRVHHWPTFWLGILILTFLSWGWIRSRTHDDLVRFRPGTGTHGINFGQQKPWYILRSTGGSIRWETRSDLSGSISTHQVDFSSTTSSPSVWFPAPYHHYAHTLDARGDDFSFSFSYTLIAYWLIILLFLITWLLYLRWRWSRMQHLAKPQPPPINP